MLVATDDGIVTIEPYTNGLPPRLIPWAEVVTSEVMKAAFVGEGLRMGQPFRPAALIEMTLAGRQYLATADGQVAIEQLRAFRAAIPTAEAP